MDLLDKNTLLAEIKRLRNSIGDDRFLSEFEKGCNQGKEEMCDEIISLINGSEIKESSFDTNFSEIIDKFDEKCGPHWCEEDLYDFAKSFFHLGLSTRTLD